MNHVPVNVRYHPRNKTDDEKYEKYIHQQIRQKDETIYFAMTKVYLRIRIRIFTLHKVARFKMPIAFDTKEKRRSFLRCARLLSLRPDFKTIQDEWRGWVPSTKTCLPFFIFFFLQNLYEFL